MGLLLGKVMTWPPCAGVAACAAFWRLSGL